MRERGHTLVELLVVGVIITVLAAVGAAGAEVGAAAKVRAMRVGTRPKANMAR